MVQKNNTGPYYRLPASFMAGVTVLLLSRLGRVGQRKNGFGSSCTVQYMRTGIRIPVRAATHILREGLC